MAPVTMMLTLLPELETYRVTSYSIKVEHRFPKETFEHPALSTHTHTDLFLY